MADEPPLPVHTWSVCIDNVSVDNVTVQRRLTSSWNTVYRGAGLCFALCACQVPVKSQPQVETLWSGEGGVQRGLP